MPIILSYEGKYPKIAADAYIADNAVIIGDVEIGSQSSVWFGCVVRGDVNYIRIGERTNIQDGTVIHVHRDAGPTIIGNGVTIGHQALLHACELQDESFIGMGAQVIDYAVVEKQAMVAAGALISPKKRVLTQQLWGGVPGRYMRQLSASEIAHFGESWRNYVTLSRKYM